MEFYRGYVPTKNKHCLMQFKDKSSEELLSLTEAKKLDEYAGILADDAVLIDIDDMAQSEKMLNLVDDLELKCRVYKSTRGMHFLFLNKDCITKSYTGTNLACGLVADIKCGKKNSYQVLKFKGEEREVIYDILDGENYDQVPFFLLPVKNTTEFSNMGEGDGRNQALFGYILSLSNEGYDKEQIKYIVKLINKYILEAPLSDTELNTICRDDAFPKHDEEDADEKFFNGSTFKFDVFSKYLLNHAAIVKIWNQLHIYRDGVYVSGDTYIEQEMIKHIARLKNSQRTEVLKYLKLIASNIEPSSERYIAFNNGILDLESKEMYEYSEQFIITNKIGFDYKCNAYSEIADKTLNRLACNDSEIRAVLEECIGYCFFRRNELRKSFMLLGEKKNGKSTFLEMLKYVIGKENTCALDLAEIGDRFRTAKIFGKLVNIGDDIDSQYIENVGNFKKVVAGNEITVENKGESPFEIQPYCKFIFSANDIPRMKDRSGAVLDRLIFIPFNATFSPSDPDFDPYIIDKLKTPEVAEYLIKIGIDALERVLKKKEFTIPEQSMIELKEFNERNNPIILFLNDITEADVNGKICSDLYLRYSNWCIENGFQAISNIEFGKTIKKKFNVESVPRKIDGKGYRIYKRKTTDDFDEVPC